MNMSVTKAMEYLFYLKNAAAQYVKRSAILGDPDFDSGWQYYDNDRTIK